MPQDRLSDTVLPKSEVNSTHTRYDYARAVPSPRDLQIQFSVLAAVNAVVATACLILFVSILRSRRVRKNSFNLYLLFIVIPDFISSASCCLTCAMSAPEGSYYSEAMCGWQSWYLVFGFTANCWMNAVIVHELYRMLRFSQQRKRYTPPTRAKVLRQAALVYGYAMALAFLGAWNIPWMPHKTAVYSGFACFPMEYDFESTLFYWLFFIPAFLLIPCLYAIWVGYDVLWRRKMIPPMGRRRTLAVYFSRLVAVYLFMWIPFLLICTIGNNTNISGWIYWSGATWSHLQGLVSAILSATKDDIREACCAFLLCREEQSPSQRDVPSESRVGQRSSLARNSLFCSSCRGQVAEQVSSAMEQAGSKLNRSGNEESDSGIRLAGNNDSFMDDESILDVENESRHCSTEPENSGRLSTEVS